jgi:hypothetical protein
MVVTGDIKANYMQKEVKIKLLPKCIRNKKPLTDL